MKRELGFRFILNPLIVLALLGSITACAPSPGYVAKEWSQTMRELNIVPVFPPREDVEVGDLYSAPLSPDEENAAIKSGEYLPLGLWVGSTKLNTELSQFYKSRLAFPKTISTPTTNPSDIYPEPTSSSDIYMAGNDNSRLRLVGFPVFMSATFNKGDLSALVPAEAVSLGIGAGFLGSSSVSVSIPVAESYGLPAHTVFTAAIDADAHVLLPSAFAHNLTTNDLVQYLPQRTIPMVRPTTAPSDRSAEVVGYLRLITEVYYARTLDISMGHTNAGGASITAKPAVTPGAALAGVPTTQPAGSTLDYDTATPQQIAGDLNQQLAASANQSVPGGSFKFLAVSRSGISMRRTYERPIAVGYRAVSIEVVRVTHSDGSAEYFVYGVGPSGSVVPTDKK